jgi:hypothetical protein
MIGQQLKQKMGAKGYVTAAEAGKLAGVSSMTVRRWGDRALVTSHRVNKSWFFLRASIVAFAGILEK